MLSIRVQADRIFINGLALEMQVKLQEQKSLTAYLARELRFRISREGTEGINTVRLLRETRQFTGLHECLCRTAEDFVLHLQKKLGSTVTASTINRYTQLARTLRRYEAFLQRKIYVRDLCEEWMQGFVTFITDVQHNHRNTACTHCMHLVRLIAHCEGCRQIPRHLLKDFRMSPQVSAKPFLSKKEVDRIAALNPASKHQRLAQQLFIIQCYTGLSYCDLRQLSQKHFSENEKGERQIVLHRKKNGKRAMIPVLQPVDKAIKVIRSLPVSPLLLAREGMLPMPVCPRYNYLLKKIAAAAKIKIPVSSHTGRRTFATSIAYAYGASLTTVATVLGHHKLNHTAAYAKVTNEKIKREITKKI